MADILDPGTPEHRALTKFGAAVTRACIASGDKPKLVIAILVAEGAVSVASLGCQCDGCHARAITHLAEAFGCEVEVTTTADPVH